MFNDESRPNDYTYAIMNQKYRNLGNFSHSVHACDNEAMSPIRGKNEMSTHDNFERLNNRNNGEVSRNYDSNNPIPNTRYPLDSTSNTDSGRRPSPAMTPASYPETPNSNSPVSSRQPNLSNYRTTTNKRRYPWQGFASSILSKLFKIEQKKKQ